jgi:phage terminase large subunit-like protein
MLKGLIINTGDLIKKNLNNKQETNIDLVDETFWQGIPIFCPYQNTLVTDESLVSIVEKGRQIGASFSYAFRASFRAVSNQRDSIVSSYNKAAVKQFIKDAAYWARTFNTIFEIISYQEVVNERDLNIFEIRFLNGRTITGLAGDAVNLRSYSGRDIYIDEAAYRADSLDDILAAGLAAIIHGGTIRVLSTHAGIDSDFNHLIESVKAGNLPYTHHRVSFKQAVKEGLFKRVCAKKKDVWSIEKEEEWVSGIYKMYGNRASEELDAEPSDYSQGGKIFKDFQFIDTSDLTSWQYIEFRYHDLAASDDDDDKNDSLYYSASVKIRYILNTNKMSIVDWTAEKLSPLEGDAQIERLALADGSKSVQLIELEPGSTGEKYVAIMQDRLIKKGIFQVFGYRPSIDKVKRAIPAGNAMCAGDLMIEAGMRDRDQFCKLITKFSNKRQPLVTDLGDCISGIYDYVTNEYNWLLSSNG